MWETFKDLLENQISRGRHNRKVLRLHSALRLTSTNVRHHFGIVALAPHFLEKRWDVYRLVNAFHSNMRLICINDSAGVELVARPNKGTFDTSLHFMSFILLHIAETVVFSPAHYRLESSLQGTEGWSSIWTRQIHGFGHRCSICYTLHDIPPSTVVRSLDEQHLEFMQGFADGSVRYSSSIPWRSSSEHRESTSCSCALRSTEEWWPSKPCLGQSTSADHLKKLW